MKGDIKAPRVAIADGAFFKGSVDMEKGSSATKEKPLREEKSFSQPSERVAARV